MANSRRNAASRGRNTRPIRSQMRQINRSLNFEPRRMTIPADPPNIIRSFTQNVVIPFNCQIGDTSGVDPGSAAGSFYPTITFAISPDKKSLTGTVVKDNDLFLCWQTYTGIGKISSDFWTELCVQRVCFWGPASPTLREVEIGIWYDQPSPGSSKSVQDVGTAIHRARCCLSASNRLWVKTDSTISRLRFDPDVASTAVQLAGDVAKLSAVFGMGRIHITLGVRRTFQV